MMRFPADHSDARIPSHPPSDRRPSAGIAAGRRAPCSRAGSALFGNWSEMDRNHLENQVCGICQGASVTFILTAQAVPCDPWIKFSACGLFAGIGIIATIASRTNWKRVDDWQHEITAVFKRHHRHIRNLKNSNAAWREASEQWRIGSMAQLDSGAEAAPASAPRGKVSRRPLGAEGGEVIDFPGRGK